MFAGHVELAHTVEGAGQKPPIDQVAGVVDLHAGKPFKRRSSDVIILANAEYRRIGVEALQNRIVDSCYGEFLLNSILLVPQRFDNLHTGRLTRRQ